MGVYDFNLEDYISLARRLGADTERVEVKAAAQGLPKSMAETLSAFSNTSGGVVVLGLAERAGFQGVPGFKARAVADALAQMCDEKMEPPVAGSGYATGGRACRYTPPRRRTAPSGSGGTS